MKTISSRRLTEVFLNSLMYLSVALTCATLFFIIGYVLVKGIPGLSWRFISTKPSYITETIGILPDILNTVYLLLLSIIILLPLGVGAAVYLNEYASNKRLVKIIDYASEILAGIPSIIYGLVGMLFFCQFLGFKTSLLSGALTLVIMNLPVLMRTTKESLISVPKGLREGSFALGAGKWRTVRTIVIPQCTEGIITGCILSSGRILGESAALLFTAGFSHALHGFFEGISSSGSTLTVALYVYAKEQGEFQVAFSIAVILLALSVVVNGAAELIKNKGRCRHK